VSIADGEEFAVVVPTRDRGPQLHRLLDELAAQTDRDFDVVVVDQSDRADPYLESGGRGNGRFHLIRDSGSGATRARNIGMRSVGSDWIAYLDDDCLPERDWAAQLRAALTTHPEAEMVVGDIGASEAPSADCYPVAVFPVTEQTLVHGRWSRPWRVGYSACVAIRRAALERLGGWDERFGPGSGDFPASDDMDLNYRFTRSGGTVYLTPHVRARHEQWRTPEELLSLYRGYSRAWGGLVMKQLRTGDPLGAVLIAAGRIKGILGVALSAVRDRSGFGLRLALWELRGFARGLALGSRRSW
jgi:GT2 family glycosyltransferase